jgi:flagellar M-ring protein FliF
MDQLKQLLARLTLRQKILIGVVTVLVGGGLFFLTHWNKERDFKPLFTNLAAEDAGQVVARIHETGVEYRLIENGGTILVPSGKVAELRLQLASAGLPKTGRIGFELFDKTNFGATDFTEQVNYHRALEGELERSVMSLAEVEQARIHLTFPKDSIYTDNRQPAKASVLVKLKLGAKLSYQNVLAICQLTASAVEGLTPDAVSVLDMNGNLLSRQKKPGLGDGPDPDDRLLEYRQKMERDLMAKLNGTLEPLLGADKYRAGLTVECDFTSGEQSEETFDPTKSVMVTSARTEDGATTPTVSGVPGAASNLPRPTSRPLTNLAGTNRRTENISYQSSRFVKHLKLPQGNVKRISLSIILDQAVRFEKGKKILDPPSPEKLKVVKDLAAGVVGIQPDRGDQVIVETLPFDATLQIQPPPPPAAPGTPSKEVAPKAPAWMPGWLVQALQDKNFPMLAGIGAGSVLVLFSGVVWLLLRMRKRKKKKAAEIAAQLEGGAAKAIQGPDLEQEIEAKFAEQAALKDRQAKEILGTLKLPAATTKKAEVLVKHIGTEAKKDPAALAQVIRTWLNNSDYQS